MIRVWVESDDHVDHGEISHVGSNAGLRFRDVEQAFRFMRRIIAGRVRKADNRCLTADC